MVVSRRGASVRAPRVSFMPSPPAQIVCGDCIAEIAKLPAESIDLVFADPPYEKTESGECYTEKLLTNDALPQLLDAHGLLVLEKRPAEGTPATKFWNIARARKYGATEVLFFSAVREEFTRRGEQSAIE